MSKKRKNKIDFYFKHTKNIICIHIPLKNTVVRSCNEKKWLYNHQSCSRMETGKKKDPKIGTRRNR